MSLDSFPVNPAQLTEEIDQLLQDRLPGRNTAFLMTVLIHDPEANVWHDAIIGNGDNELMQHLCRAMATKMGIIRPPVPSMN